MIRASSVSCSVAFGAALFALISPAAAAISEAEANAIAQEAYVYLYPQVLMDITRRVTTNRPAGEKPGTGPMGAFHHFREYPGADFREVVRPNFDTLYSMAWFDVGSEPYIVSVPDTKGRYYVMSMYDMWTDVFAAPGSRTSGTGAGNFAITSLSWKGTLPGGVERIEARTAINWIIVRTQTNGPKDYAAVHPVQDGFKLTPLSQWGKPATAIANTSDPTVDMDTPPLRQTNELQGARFFTYAAELMKQNRPHVSDWSILARMKRIGLEAGKSFDYAKADKDVQRAIDAAPAASQKTMLSKRAKLAPIVNGWQMNTDTTGSYGNFYLKRAIIAMAGLGANNAEDAVYPLLVADADGKPLDGANKYVLKFTKAELPPADAFWSITMYDAEGFQTANALNRYALGDRDALKYNADGSLDISIQHESPGKEREANWLPSPLGPLGVTMRLYAPKPQVFDGSWNPPPVKRVQ